MKKQTFISQSVSNRSNKLSILAIVISFLGCGVTANAAPFLQPGVAPFVHPGVWQTETDLERVRKMVAAGDEPWLDAWKAIENKDVGKEYKAHPDAVVTNAYAIQTDGHAAYVLTIKWVASGDVAYANAAEAIIDTWVDTVTSAAPTTMRNGLGSAQMAAAADILAYGFHGASGWSPDHVAKAKVWFKKVVYPQLKNGASANWGTSVMTGIMSMGIFCDDQEMFDAAISAYKHGFVVNGSLKDGCSGVTQYIDATGENAESGRDQPHSQGGVAHLVEVALAASNQGIDLVKYNDASGVLNYKKSGDYRLFMGLEYMAKYNTGGDVPYHPFFEYCNNVTKYPDGVSAINRGHFSPMWEMAVFLLKKEGLNPLYSEKVVESSGYRPETTNSDHPGMGTLLYATQPMAKPASTGVSLLEAPRARFVHPGIWQTETDLERVRAGAASGGEPWLGAWNALKDKEAGKGYTAHPIAIMTDAYGIQNDGHAAFVLAIKWVVTGDIAYAQTAQKIIDTWADTVTELPDSTLRNGLGASQMAAAADILAYGFQGKSGWSPQHIANAKKWFQQVVYPRIKDGAAAGWGTPCTSAIMSMAIFCDDQAMFDAAVSDFKHGFVVNGSLKNGCAGVTQYIDATGENAESGRDQPHSQGTMSHLLEVALAASNQGVDLLSYNDQDGVLKYKNSGADRLLLGFEYSAKFNLGGKVQYHPFFEYCNNVTIYADGVSEANRGHFSPVWEMAVYLFKKEGLNPVYSEQVLDTPGYRPETTNGDHPGLGTLLFGRAPTSAAVTGVSPGK